jgi:hypothetical protein
VVVQPLSHGKTAAAVALWYVALFVIGGELSDAAPDSFPIALAWAAFWTLPGVATPMLVASRFRVLSAMAVPLCTAAVVILMAFALTGLASCRPDTRRDFGAFLVVGTLGGVAWSAGWISFRTSRPAWLAGLVAVAGAAMLGFFPFLADHCDFGDAHEYGIVTFVWPVLLIFTSPIALVGALVGALAGAARTRLRNRRASLDPGVGQEPVRGRRLAPPPLPPPPPPNPRDGPNR